MIIALHTRDDVHAAAGLADLADVAIVCTTARPSARKAQTLV